MAKHHTLFLALALASTGSWAIASEGPRERHQVSPEVIAPHLNSGHYAPGHRYYRHHPAYGYYRYPGWFGYSPYMGQYAPAIGRSSIWMTAGSNSYIGGGFSTRQPIGDSPFVYGVAVSREQGQTWHPDIDFRRSTISPWLEWHGENTSIYGGFSRSTHHYSGGRQ